MTNEEFRTQQILEILGGVICNTKEEAQNIINEINKVDDTGFILIPVEEDEHFLIKAI